MKIEISEQTYNKLKKIKDNWFEGYDFDKMIQYLLVCYDQTKNNRELYKKMESEMENLIKLSRGT